MKKIIRYLFGYCRYCYRWFTYPRKHQTSTEYPDPLDNYERCCKRCHQEHEEILEQMRQDYNNGRI